MEENKIIVEQPLDKSSKVAEANIDNSANNNLDNGSTIGKFKDANSLLCAYEKLEKEFTRKSQKISELEKSISSDNIENSIPLYEKENWRNDLNTFLSNNKMAQKYASEIANVLLSDNNLAKLPNCLEFAYNKILSNKYKPEDELLADKNFLEKYIYNNENIKNTIIGNYLENINSNKIPPLVLNNKGSTFGVYQNDAPKNLSEAKIIVEKLLK